MNQRADRLLFWIRLLSLLGIVLSVVLIYEHVRLEAGLGGKSFCNISRTINCDAVSQSSWAKIFGFPVAGYGFGFYICVFLTALLGAGGRYLPLKIVSGVLLLFAAFSLVFSLYLFFVSAFVIHSFCILCAGLYIVNILFFLLALRLEVEASFTQRLAGGVGAVWRFFIVCLKGLAGQGDGSDRVMACSGLAVLALVAVLVFSLPDMIAMRVVLPKLQSAQHSQALEMALESWRGNRKAEISFQERGLERDYRRGPATAPITVVDFSDFECPACREFYREFEELADRFPGKINLVFRNFPLDKDCNPLIDREFHQSACYAAMFSRCAGEQEKFWEALDYLFRLEELDSGSPGEARSGIDLGGRALGLDTAALEECMKSRRHAAKLASDAREGEALGVEGTPSVWVNGKKVEAVNSLVLKSIFAEIISGTAPSNQQ